MTAEFKYRPRDEASLLRRLAQHDATARWNEAITKAWEGDKVPLRDYLKSDMPLDADRREAIADLLDPPKRGRGRPSKPDSTPRARALRRLLGRVRFMRLRWLKANPKEKELPKRMRPKLAAEALEFFALDDEFPEFAVPITVKAIVDAWASGVKKRKPARSR